MQGDIFFVFFLGDGLLSEPGFAGFLGFAGYVV